MLALIILIARRGAFTELAIGPVCATNLNEMPPTMATLLTMAYLELLLRHGWRYKTPQQQHRMRLSNPMSPSSGRSLFLLTQSGSVYSRRTTSIGSSIASLRLVGNAAPVQH